MSQSMFPPLTRAYIRAFQFSAWYPIFEAQSIKSTIVRPLDAAFRAYLDADGVFVPDGAEDVPAESTLSDDEDGAGEGGEDGTALCYAFPALDTQIRACVREYGGVFPKLNFSAPKDAAWLLPASSPLKCTSPADVYLLLKSSDFVTHDLSSASVFEGCVEGEGEGEGAGEGNGKLELELVLRKWYPVDRAREVRCFVRGDKFVALSQRDTNFYDFWADERTRTRVAGSVHAFWEQHVRPRWPAQKDYILDLLLTRDLARAHIVDFNPYHPKTDPLLFTYEELAGLYNGREVDEHVEATATTGRSLPLFRVIGSAAHPAAARNAPAHQHNMIPFEAATMSSGHDIEQFAEMWKDSVKANMQGADDNSDGDDSE